MYCQISRLVVFALALISYSVPFVAAAESSFQPPYPSHAIILVAPFAAGGPTDIVARLLAARMSEILGQSIAVEDIVGSGGTTAALRVKRAEPDGYTIMIGHLGTHAAVAGYFPGVYDPVQDFAAIGLIVRAPVVVVARRDLPPKTLADFAAYARTHTVVLGHAGIGSVSFTTCALLDSLLRITPKIVAFNGTQPAMEALLAGRVDYLCDQTPTVVGPVSAGKVRAYAITTRERSPSLPDTPTASEAGQPNFNANSWMGLFAPKSLPPQIAAKLNAALSEALDSADVRQKLDAFGAEIPSREERTQASFAEFVKREAQRWPSIVKAVRPTD
jgi:tripartite-type tricarboxylate transporter receptor subunit TctC